MHSLLFNIKIFKYVRNENLNFSCRKHDSAVLFVLLSVSETYLIDKVSKYMDAVDALVGCPRLLAVGH